MNKPAWIDPLSFVMKVIVLSALMAIALKVLGPRLAIPATTAASLAIVLTPFCAMGSFLCWQLWTSNHAHPTHPRHH